MSVRVWRARCVSVCVWRLGEEREWLTERESSLTELLPVATMLGE